MIILQIIFVMVIGLTIAGLMAPSESLTWWQRSNVELPDRRKENHVNLMSWPSIEEAKSGPVPQKHEIPSEIAEEAPTANLDHNDEEADHYLIYLSGIGSSGPDQLPVSEIPMVNQLSERLGGTKVIWDIYPYSVENQSLTTGRRLSGLWRTLRMWKFEKKPGRILASLINIRNAFQMFVSSDRRYGPVFNLAVAQQIAAALLRHGYNPDHLRPVTLLGWSGGAQIAVGATWYLAALGMPVRVLSMGGIMSSDPGIDRAEQIWHLHGHNDVVEKSGNILFARRLPIFKHSSWNRAIRAGRIQKFEIGNLTHVGKRGYYSKKVKMPDGRTPFQTSADAIVDLLVDNGLAVDLSKDDSKTD